MKETGYIWKQGMALVSQELTVIEDNLIMQTSAMCIQLQKEGSRETERR